MELSIEAVLPLKLSGDWQQHDLQRARMLFRSFDKFWSDDAKLSLTIITRQEDASLVLENLKSGKVDITVVLEEDLLPDKKFLRETPGWYKQQIIKLAAHRFVRREFYLLLDADVLCVKPFRSSDLIIDGRALTDWEPTQQHAEWWTGSARVLQMGEALTGMGMSVTPEIFSKKLCERLDHYLSDSSGRNAWLFLADHRNWTEYSLYTTFALKHGIMLDFHHSDDWMQSNKRRLRSPFSLWSKNGFQSWTPERAFSEESNGIFMVCQSNTEISPQILSERLEAFIPL